MANWTSKDYEAWQTRNLPPRKLRAERGKGAVGKAKSAACAARIMDGMNGLEKRYADHLEMRRNAGELHSWKFIGKDSKYRFCLTPNLDKRKCYYKADFWVVPSNGPVEFHETKGFWRSRDRVRIKIVADRNPELVFIGVRRVDRAWEYERFSAAPAPEWSVAG